MDHCLGRNLPAAQLEQPTGLALREARPDDEVFLLRLFEETHGQEVASLPVSSEQRAILLRMQFLAQRAGYRRDFAGLREYVIECEGEPAGKLSVAQGEEVRIVDVSVCADRQRRGIGTAVLEEELRKASRAGKKVRLHVVKANTGALRLYERLGFKTTAASELFVEMEWADIYGNFRN